MNDLLARNAANLEKARRHVANLAHGLKTPIATLSLEVESLSGPGKGDVRALVAQIDLRIRHHLARARAAAIAGPTRSRTPLAPRLRDLGDAMGHIHADRNIEFALDCGEDLAVGCEPHDIDEILGNLLDNAFKFARSRVRCSATAVGKDVHVMVADDGPGLSDEEIDAALRPGQRLDENGPGFGFGLTIARELTELYGGELKPRPSDGGLLVDLTLPGRFTGIDHQWGDQSSAS
jgi:signal transduction histidine kinase